jgi:hypothetical protein
MSTPILWRIGVAKLNYELMKFWRRSIAGSNKTAPEDLKNRETVLLIVLRNRSETFSFSALI